MKKAIFAGVIVAAFASSVQAQNQGSGPSAESMVDRIVATDSRGWAMNRYVPGSVSNASVTRQGNSIWNYSIVANFRYVGGGTGWVEARFVDGVISCVRYHNFPGTCRAVGDYSYQMGAVAAPLVVAAVAGAASSGASSNGSSNRSARYESKAQADAWDHFCHYNGC